MRVKRGARDCGVSGQCCLGDGIFCCAWGDGDWSQSDVLDGVHAFQCTANADVDFVEDACPGVLMWQLTQGIKVGRIRREILSASGQSADEVLLRWRKVRRLMSATEDCELEVPWEQSLKHFVLGSLAVQHDGDVGLSLKFQEQSALELEQTGTCRHEDVKECLVEIKEGDVVTSKHADDECCEVSLADGSSVCRIVHLNGIGYDEQLIATEDFLVRVEDSLQCTVSLASGSAWICCDGKEVLTSCRHHGRQDLTCEVVKHLKSLQLQTRVDRRVAPSAAIELSWVKSALFRN